MGGWLDLSMIEANGWRLLAGLEITVEVVAISCSIGFVLSYPIALMRMARNPVPRTLSLCYVTFFRGTPLLCQLYLVYYGAGEIRPFLTSLGLWWFFRQAFYCCVFAFSLNTAAYQAEIVRGALLSVSRGQIEAAQALGLSRYRVARHVVFPQALLVALRPLGNELISIIKASALAAIVTLLDLMGQTRLIFARTFDFSIYLYAALIYLAMTALIARVWNLVERRLTRHLRKRADPVSRAVGAPGTAPSPTELSTASQAR
ncbi:MAG: ABC transporter permease [Acetobacteraceae bacterium]|nr:ABC transporter permease [Acetobacteraceae bacterium]